GQLRTCTQRTNQVIATEHQDVTEGLVARLLAGPDRVAAAAEFAARTEGVLRRSVGLALQREEVRDVQIFGLQPGKEHRILRLRTGDVDVIVGGNPLFGSYPVPGLQRKRHRQRLPGPEFELLARGRVEEATVGLNRVLAWRKIEFRAALQQQVMVFVIA